MQDISTLQHITDISSYFRVDGKQMIFIGDHLEVHIPKRYETYDLLSISDTLVTIGIMTLIIDHKVYTNLLILARIEMIPYQTEVTSHHGKDYVIATFDTESVFIKNRELIRLSNVAYAIYNEFINRGNILYSMSYTDLFTLFDRSKELCDIGFSANHAVFEVVYGYLSRTKDSIYTQFRHTEMQGDQYKAIPLADIAHASNNTMARLVGSYFDAGLVASMLHQNDTIYPLEALVRGVSEET